MRCKDAVFYNQGGEALAWVAMVDAISLEAFQVSLDRAEQPDLVKGILPQSNRVRLDDL